MFPARRSLQGEDRLGLIRSGTKIGSGVGPEWGGPKEGRRRWKGFETDLSPRPLSLLDNPGNISDLGSLKTLI